MGENGYNTRGFLRNIYTTKFYDKFLLYESEVLTVEYPFVRVSRAQYNPNTKELLINFSTEKNNDFSNKIRNKIS